MYFNTLCFTDLEHHPEVDKTASQWSPGFPMWQNFLPWGTISSYLFLLNAASAPKLFFYETLNFLQQCLKTKSETEEARKCDFFFSIVHVYSASFLCFLFTRLPPTHRPPGWSGSNAAHMSPCQTPPPWASHAGCSSSGTSWWDTSGTCEHSGRLNLRSSDQITSDCSFFPENSPFGELLLWRDVDFVLHAADLHNVSQVSRLPIHLDPLFEEDLLLGRAQWCTREENPSQAGAREGSPSPEAGLTFGKHA